MLIAVIIIIVLLVIAIIGLIMYNVSIHKKLEEFSNTNQKITSLNVLQDFMDTISETSSVDDKLKKINDILIEKYGIKYSTIVVYNGAEFVIRASNVAEKHWETLKNLQSEPVFADSIETGIPKYITVEKEGEKLPYQKMEFGRAKAAMFFPIYIDNVYIGYWIIEGSTPHEFDNVDTTILEVVKNNIVAVLKTVENQSTIEKIVRDDQYSELKTAEYLYTEGKNVIMGRKTYDILGKYLRERNVIVFSNNPDFRVSTQNAKVVHSMLEIQQYIEDKNENYVIGGAMIYRLLMQYVTKLYVTEVDKDFDGDAVFPRINEEVWKEVSRDENQKDENNDLTYDFITYVKR